MQGRRWWIVAIAASAAACADDPATAPTSRIALADVTAVPENFVARSIAMALARPEPRRIVRDAWRASPWTEHKLVLSEFVRTDAGVRFLGEMARAARTSPEELSAVIEALPPHDFYVPARDDRRAWRATPNIVVAVSRPDDGGEWIAFTPDGLPAVRSARARDGRAVILLQPSESKDRRVAPQRAVSGEVIQDPDDGEIAGRMGWQGADGRWYWYDLSGAPISADGEVTAHYDDSCIEPLAVGGRLFPSCDGGSDSSEPTTSPTLSSTAPKDTTLIAELQIRGVEDNNNPYEGNEFEFTGSIIQGDGSRRSFVTVRRNGVASVDLIRDIILMYDELRGSDRSLSVTVKELDSWLNPNDKFGTHYPTWEHNWWDGQNLFYKMFWGGAYRCYYPPLRSPPCDSSEPIVKQVGLSFEWNPYNW